MFSKTFVCKLNSTEGLSSTRNHIIKICTRIKITNNLIAENLKANQAEHNFWELKTEIEQRYHCKTLRIDN